MCGRTTVWNRAVPTAVARYAPFAAVTGGRRRKPIIQCHYTQTRTHVYFAQDSQLLHNGPDRRRTVCVCVCEYCNARAKNPVSTRTVCLRVQVAADGLCIRRARVFLRNSTEKRIRVILYTRTRLLLAPRPPMCIIRVSIVCRPRPVVRILTGIRTHVLEKYPNPKRRGVRGRAWETDDPTLPCT